jgi:hypothetical protein
VEAARLARRETRAKRLEAHFADVCPVLIMPHAQKNLRKISDNLEQNGETSSINLIEFIFIALVFFSIKSIIIRLERKKNNLFRLYKKRNNINKVKTI